MTTFLLLFIIYMAFISLGLPDALLGISWPLLRLEWGLPVEWIGTLSILITGSTILSSLFSGYFIKKMGTGKITFISCLMTGLALIGYSYAPHFYWLLALSVPLGLGAGSVDTALNHYVALHFKAHHMNWLHSFWGVGATMGPLIMARAISSADSWRFGYLQVGGFQIGLALLLLMSLPLWRKHHHVKTIETEQKELKQTKLPIRYPVFIKGVPFAMLTFLLYCAVEFSIGLWGSSFLVSVKDIPPASAARWVAMYYGGITLGRFTSGFLSFKLSNCQMIRLGMIISSCGGVLMLWSSSHWMIQASMLLLGIGFAPVFPSMIHETPYRFGGHVAHVIIGYQMASAYLGSALLPPLFGLIARYRDLSAFPWFVLMLIFLMFFTSEYLRGIKYDTSS